jgi:hypothetical protein
MNPVRIRILALRDADASHSARIDWRCPECGALNVDYPDDAPFASIGCQPRDCGDEDEHCGTEYILDRPRRIRELLDCTVLVAYPVEGVAW